VTRPLVGWVMVICDGDRILSSVLLPAPLRPMMVRRGVAYDFAAVYFEGYVTKGPEDVIGLLIFDF